MVRDPAEALFERYLTDRGYVFEYEQDLGTPKRPDYLVHAVGSEVVCEVKSFSTMGIFASPGGNTVGTRLQAEALASVRSHISKAAAQLKGIEGRPLVVVLANPLGQPVPLEPYEVMAAMYGDLTVQFPLRADGSTGNATWHAGRNRRLRVTNPDSGEAAGGDHAYISAIAVLRNRNLAFDSWSKDWFEQHRDEHPDAASTSVSFLAAAQYAGVPGSDDVFLHVFETVSEEAVQLPRDIFNGPHDRRWVPDEERSALIPFLH